MRHSTSSASRILTILSFSILCSLSFPTVYAQDIVDTPHYQNRDVHHRRAIHHIRASSSDTPSLTPTSSPSPTPSATQSPSVGTTSASSSDTPVPSSTSSNPTSSPADSSTSSAGPTSTSSPSDTTTPTTTSASQASSNPASTPSSSGTTSSPSSNTSPTTSISSAKSNSPTGGSTTAHLSNTAANSGLSLSSEPTSTVFASPTGASSKGFLANKVAVGATFSIVGILCGLAAVMGAITLIRRYRRARDNDDDFYEKYSGAPGSANHSRFSREPHNSILGQGPLGASATDLSFDAAPPEAYPDRAIHYGQPNPTTVFRPVDYGIDYPPNAGADTTAAAADPENTDIAYENYEYDPNRPHSGSAGGSHPFADPANASRTAPAHPVTYQRPVQGRAQDMVEVDSYYGPNSAGVGVSGLGYAQ